jgi:chromosome segregation ATPase
MINYNYNDIFILKLKIFISKLEEMADMKTQLKQMEDNNSKYLEKIIQLEEEVKRIVVLKSQIEMYKKQLHELHEQVLNGEMKMKKLEYEYKSVEEVNMQLRADKQKLENDLERLKDTNEELTINNNINNSVTFNSSTIIGTDDQENPIFSGLELFNISAETK